jgi:hypothetical protein
MTEHEPEAVRGQLERILASEGFANADRISRFLRFTLESKLSGDQDRIKEYVIGREVFDRDSRYDPRIDPIVRVEARRLRARLAEYYEGPGRGDAIRIELPKGGYVPLVASVSVPNGAETGGSAVSRKRVFWLVSASVLLLAVAIAALYAPRGNRDRDMVAVVPAAWFWQGRSGLSEVEEGLSETIAAELANRGIARVVAWPLLSGYRNAGRQTSSLAADMGVSKLLLVSARENGAGANLTVFFVDGITNQKYWTLDWSLGDSSRAREQSEAARIADAIQAKLPGAADK